jgi:hypothetical protein
VMDRDRVPAQYLRTPLPLYCVKESRNSVDLAEKNTLVPAQVERCSVEPVVIAYRRPAFEHHSSSPLLVRYSI